MTRYNFRRGAGALALTGLLFLCSAPISAQSPGAKAALKTTDGKDAGAVTMTQTPHGVLIALTSERSAAR
jgi:hypothetical protein